jgi:hypothetical protein
MLAQPAAHFAKLWSARGRATALGGRWIRDRVAASDACSDCARHQRSRGVAFPPFPPKAVALPRALQSAPREISIEAGHRSTLFHVSHSLCRPVFVGCRSATEHENEPFPQPNHPPNPHADIFFGRVCYFLRKLTLKPAEKCVANHAWKRCAKRVENALIFCGLLLERLCKNLRITCGEDVESQRRTH